MKRILITFLVLGVICPVFAYPYTTTILLMSGGGHKNHHKSSQIGDEFYSCKQNKGGNACYINRCIKYGGGITSCTNKYMKK